MPAGLMHKYRREFRGPRHNITPNVAKLLNSRKLDVSPEGGWWVRQELKFIAIAIFFLIDEPTVRETGKELCGKKRAIKEQRVNHRRPADLPEIDGNAISSTVRKWLRGFLLDGH